MADTTIMEIDWDAMRRTAEPHTEGMVVRVNDARHVVAAEPTAASWDGERPAACTDGDWAIRREIVADGDGTEREIAHYHAIRRLP